MKYMLLIYSSATDEVTTADKADAATLQRWLAYDRSVREAGIWVSGEPLADHTTATVVRVGRGGERTVTDGPFPETREVLGGYYLIDVPDLDVALDWAARCPGAQDGTVVVWPVAEL